MESGRVAVTGHRMNRLPALAPARLFAKCRELFATPHPDCILLSCLADGTDLIAASAWPADRTLETLLPVPVPVWRRIISAYTEADALDAALARSTPEIISEDGEPDYVALAGHLIDRCDRLFAVWDGNPGKPGGTGSVVARAHALGKPVLHLPLDAFADGQEP